MARELAKVSVVMSVYDKPNDVLKTINSVLAQEDVDLDFIVVSDGASVGVLEVLARFEDSRLRVLHQANQGLTAALIYGCQHVKHELIARIDAGDTMLAGRLSKQAARLEQDSQLALVSCWVQMHTDEGFDLYPVQHSDEELQNGICATSIDQLKSPVHSSVMFRKSLYQAAGGYRKSFYFAQDCDLWPRLIKDYNVCVVPEFLQRNVFSVSGISGQNQRAQKSLAALVVDANILRAQSKSDAKILDIAQQIHPDKSIQSRTTATGDFDGNYFIASVLSDAQPQFAIIYWRKALVERPLHITARVKYCWCWLRASFS